MPTGVYPIEKRRGLFPVGHPDYVSAETRKKQGEKIKGIKNPKISEKLLGNKHCVGRIPWNKKLKGFNAGKKHWNWRGGISTKNDKLRHNFEMSLWRKAVLERDNFTCQKYKTKGGILVAHHINNFAEYPELRTAIDNGITLSKKAHKEFHKIYGYKNNTKEQLEEFFNQQKYEMET